MTNLVENQQGFWLGFLEMISKNGDAEGMSSNGYLTNINFGNNTFQWNKLINRFADVILQHSPTHNTSNPAAAKLSDTYKMWLDGVYPKSTYNETDRVKECGENPATPDPRSTLEQSTEKLRDYKESLVSNLTKYFCNWLKNNCMLKDDDYSKFVTSKACSTSVQNIATKYVENADQVDAVQEMINQFEKNAELICKYMLVKYSSYMEATYSDWVANEQKNYGLYQNNLDTIRSKCYGPGFPTWSASMDGVKNFKNPVAVVNSPSMAVADTDTVPRFDYDDNEISSLQDIIEQLKGGTYTGKSYNFSYDQSTFDKSVSSWDMAADIGYGDFFAVSAGGKVSKSTEKMSGTDIQGYVAYEYITAIKVSPSMYWYQPIIFDFLSYYNLTKYTTCKELLSDPGLFSLIPDTLYVGVNPSISLISSQWSSIEKQMNIDTNLKLHIGPFSFSLGEVKKTESNYHYDSTAQGFTVSLKDYIPKMIAYHAIAPGCKDDAVTSKVNIMTSVLHDTMKSPSLTQKDNSCKYINSALDLINFNSGTDGVRLVLSNEKILHHLSTDAISLSCILKSEDYAHIFTGNYANRKYICNNIHFRDQVLFNEKTINLDDGWFSVKDFVDRSVKDFCSVVEKTSTLPNVVTTFVFDSFLHCALPFKNFEFKDGAGGDIAGGFLFTHSGGYFQFKDNADHTYGVHFKQNDNKMITLLKDNDVLESRHQNNPAFFENNIEKIEFVLDCAGEQLPLQNEL